MDDWEHFLALGLILPLVGLHQLFVVLLLDYPLLCIEHGTGDFFPQHADLVADLSTYFSLLLHFGLQLLYFAVGLLIVCEFLAVISD